MTEPKEIEIRKKFELFCEEFQIQFFKELVFRRFRAAYLMGQLEAVRQMQAAKPVIRDGIQLTAYDQFGAVDGQLIVKSKTAKNTIHILARFAEAERASHMTGVVYFDVPIGNVLMSTKNFKRG